MTDLLDKAVELVRRLPSDNQDEIARAILRLAVGEVDDEPIEPKHLPSVLRGLEQANKREFATEQEIEAAFRRFDR